MKPGMSKLAEEPDVVEWSVQSAAAPEKPGGGPGKGLQGLTRALQVLRLFTEGETLGARAVGERMDLNPAVAHRILSTFTVEGFLEQDPVSRSYGLGWVTGELGDAYHRVNPIFLPARRVLGNLSSATGETAALQVVRNGHRVCLMQHESDQRLRYSMVLHTPMPVTNGATDQVMRAFASEAQLAAIRSALDEAASGSRSPALMGLDAPRRLEADFSSVSDEQLAKVRDQGWAYGLGLREPGVGSVAVPVRADNELFVLTVFGPQERIESAGTVQLIAALSAAAATLEDSR